MNRTDSIYVALMNVPIEYLFIQEYNTFVEIRAEILAWDNGQPKFELLLQNLNILMATNIMWEAYAPTLDEHVTNVFKARKDGRNEPDERSGDSQETT